MTIFQELKNLCPNFYKHHQDHELSSNNMIFGALATYFVFLLESKNHLEIDQILLFIDLTLNHKDQKVINAATNNFLLTIYDLESLGILTKNSLIKVLNKNQKKVLSQAISNKIKPSKSHLVL